MLKMSVSLFLPVLFLGCSSKTLKYEKEAELQQIKGYEEQVEVKEIAEPVSAAAPSAKPPAAVVANEKKTETKKTVKKARPGAPPPAAPPPAAPKKRLPMIEDSEGFAGRRPLNDPFRVGEKVTLDVTYFNVKAGEIDLSVKPFVEFNGKKAYHFDVDLKSYSLFSRIYSVDDKAKTYVDYESLRPHNLEITIKESKQRAETRTLFDWEKNKASYWKKRFTTEKGEEKKELTWDIKEYSQNVVSALYYLRTFQLKVGKKLAFRVADEGKNIVFTGEVIRREEIDTKLGKMKTVVVKPSLEVDGAFKPVGEILVWLTDDDRKFIVRVESKIKIGTLIGKLKSIDKGRE